MTVIKALQPFQPPLDDRVVAFCRQHGLKTSELNGLALLGKFDNADKHRELITVASGLESAEVTVSHRGQTIRHELLDAFREDRAELIRVDFGTTAPPETEVDVQVSGTVRVAIEVRKDRGVTGLPGTLARLVTHVREVTKAITQPEIPDDFAAHRA